ncbi:MAG: preprotein translocase subunit SecA [Gammaproteobacteria bacterium]|nr:preprotein translocase subunit SecA [Gammaproteobacteria bacterium]
MFTSIAKKIFGSRNERIIKRLEQKVVAINQLEASMEAKTAEDILQLTDDLKARFKQGASLDELLIEAFAVVREASKRTLGLRHFDVQMIGGMALHEGNIAEMRTGEGKTLVATLPAYLNALSGQGVHIVTVNDYLAKRDSEWMRPVFEYLGLTVGVIYPDMPIDEKKMAYASDVLYGTNNEFGFDYLRDNMAFNLSEKAQKNLNFAIIDEVDSILIDEARTPLIISGAAENSSDLYTRINTLIPHLKQQIKEEGSDPLELGHYTLDEKQKQAYLTDLGHELVEKLLIDEGLLDEGESLYDARNIILMHHVNAALRAHKIFQRDIDYIVQNNEVVIVDEHTGRTMQGRRWSDGLHQAIEAKEHVPIQSENQTLASITFQNYFRLYSKLSGMTGTADTEAYEFQHIYNLEVVVIPTNRKTARKDQADIIYLTQAEKFTAIIDDILACVSRKQPVLVGTASIEASESLSLLLSKRNIKHNVLNAKFHEKEAHIVAEAGRPGMVTIATNMAGRGTDIVLGGSLQAELATLDENTSEQAKQAIIDAWQIRHDEAIAAGGLHIIGSERHESRRIDNQLRGRAGRQGDPGSTCFYLSLEDHLMRLFASEKMAGIMRRLGMQPGEEIVHPLISRAIENAQRKLEGYYFDIRKQLLSYDNVANEQRKVIYAQRAVLLELDSLEESIDDMLVRVFKRLINTYIPAESFEDQWQIEDLSKVLAEEFFVNINIQQMVDEDHHLTALDIQQKVIDIALAEMKSMRNHLEITQWSLMSKGIILETLDLYWREHLAALDYLRQGIHLRGYAQKDPKQEYKKESFYLFSRMFSQLEYEVIARILSLNWQSGDEVASNEGFDDEGMGTNVITLQQNKSKIGRNDPCSCGSGEKYKNCHGKLV